MNRLRRLIIATLLPITLTGMAHAVSAPAAPASTASWSESALQINLSFQNSGTTVNPAGTLYFIGASIQSLGTVPNGDLASDGLGHVVVSPFSVSDPAAVPAANDTIPTKIGPLLAQTTYYLYAQACPPSTNPGTPRQANDAPCSAWTPLSAAPTLTQPLSDPHFAAVETGDVSFSTMPYAPTVTLHANPSSQDAQYITDWKVVLNNLTYKTTSPILLLPGSAFTQTVGWNNWSGFSNSSSFRVQESFVYPYKQTSLTEGSTFYTSTEPIGILPGDGIVGVTSTTVTVQFHNALDARWPNPTGASYLLNALTVFNGVQVGARSALIIPVGVSSAVYTMTVTGLLPGSKYSISIQAQARGPVTALNSVGFSTTTLGDPPAAYNDQNFPAVTSGDVTYSNVRFRSSLIAGSTQAASVTSWSIGLQNLTYGTMTQLTFAPSRFTTFQGKLAVIVSTKDWSGLTPNSAYVAHEQFVFNGITTSPLATPPTFYMQAHPPGVSNQTILRVSGNDATVQFTNSNDPLYPNPRSTGFNVVLTDIVSSQTFRGAGTDGSGVSSTTIPVLISGLTANTTYVMTVIALSRQQGWPGFGPVNYGIVFTGIQNQSVSIDPASVTSSSATATLFDVAQSSNANHYIVSYGTQTVRGAWTRGASDVTLVLTHLSPGTPYQVTAQVCTSADDSVCTFLTPGLFTSQPGQVTPAPYGVGASSITVHWTDPSDPSGTLYSTTLCDVSGSSQCFTVVGSTKTSTQTGGSALFTGLTEGDTYQATVQALNITGSPWPDGVPLVFPQTVRTVPAIFLNALSAVFNFNGFPLDNTQVCVPSQATLVVTFNRDLDTTSIPSGVIVEHRAYEDGGAGQPFTASTVTYSTVGGFRLTVAPPSGGWPDGDPIRITLTTELHDKYPTHLQAPFVVSFVPWAQGSSAARELTSFVNPQAQGAANAPNGALDPNTCTVLRTQFIAPANALAANVSQAQNPALYTGIRTSAHELVSVRTGQRVSDTFPAPITLRLPFPPNTTTTQGNSGAVPVSFVMVYLNPQTLELEPVPGSTTDGSFVQATVKQPGVYMIAESFQSTDISAAYAYPVPYRSTMGIPGITFANLGAESSIRVFTPSGLKVLDVAVPVGTTLWVWNLHSDPVASGVYLYRIDSPSGTKKGKLIIIQ